MIDQVANSEATLEFASRAKVSSTDERSIRTYASLCGRYKVAEVTSRLDDAHYWLAIHVLPTGEYPINLNDGPFATPRSHNYRCRKTAEGACRQHLDPASFQPTRSETMSKRKTTASKTAAPKATKAKPEKGPAAEKGGSGRAKPAKAKAEKPAGKKLSAIDAAAQVLAHASAPMSTKEMIEQMAAKSLWTSPGGKTPEATLYSAIIREISAKGKEARFVKSERGRFAAAK